MASLLPPAVAGSEPVRLVDATLRCQWTWPETSAWRVRWSLVDAAEPGSVISEVRNLSDADGSTGALELSADGSSLLMEPRPRLAGGAVQFRVRGSRETRLRVEFTGKADGEDWPIEPMPARELTLAEIVEAGAITSNPEPTSEGASEPAWTVARITGDELRVDGLPAVPVYEPQQPLHFSVRTSAMLRHASRQLTLQCSLERVSDGETVWSHRRTIPIDADGNSQPIPIDEAVPPLAGVYELRCQIAEDDKFWSKLRRRDPPIVRVGRPLLVIADPAADASSQTNWRSIGEIRPSESSWSMGQWLPKPTSRFIPGSSAPKPGPQSTAELASRKHAGESVSVIPAQVTFQATLPVLKPGLPHQVSIRYPAAQRIRLQVDVGGSNARKTAAVSFLLSHVPEASEQAGWRTHHFVHYPTGDDQIWLTNLDPAVAVSFESISVQAGPDYLSSPGQLQAPARLRRAVLRLADLTWVDALSSDLDSAPGLADCDASTVALCRLRIATDRLRDYALANGMNGILVPANSGGRAWFDSATMFPCRGDSSDQGEHGLEIFLRLIKHSGLDIFVAVETTPLLSGLERAIRQQPALVAQLTRGRSAALDPYNALHPLVQSSLAALLAEVEQPCQAHSCFAGLVLLCDQPSPVQPIRAAGHDPDASTLALFAQAMSLSGSPAEQRKWISEQGQQAFESWLHGVQCQLHTLLGESAANKPRWIVLPPSPSDLRGDAERAGADAMASRDLLQSGLIPIASFRYGDPVILAKRSSLQQQLASIAVADRGWIRAADLGDEASRTAGQPAVVRDQRVADLGRLVDLLDPAILIVELPIRAGTLRAELAATLRLFAALPEEPLQRINPTDPASQTVHVRGGTQGGHAYLSMTSLVPWTSEVELDTAQPIEWEPVMGTTLLPDSPVVRQSKPTRVRVLVPAGRLVVIKSKSPAASPAVKSWSSRIGGGIEVLEQIKRDVTLIVERIGILADLESYDALSNGGFEQSGEMGLVGWLQAQHPPGCVRIDDKEQCEGQHSVLLTTEPATSTRTWIVSETMDPPVSGRLAVSLACRGELEEGGSPHRLRVSIEATRNGEPIRYSAEFGVPRNGQWGAREVVLEADGIEAAEVDSLRLTIDSLSGGRVWIDDVRLHDQFPTAKERGDLQSQAFLAVQGLQRGNLTASGRLLQNHWALHLLNLGPVPQARRATEATSPPEEAPGVAERIRSWLPQPLRF